MTIDPSTLIRVYFHQFTHGCEHIQCSNPLCRSCPHFSPAISSANDAASLALKVARDRSSSALCINTLPKHLFDPSIPVRAAHFQTAILRLDPQHRVKTVTDELKSHISEPLSNLSLFGYLAMENSEAVLTAQNLHLPTALLQTISHVTNSHPELFRSLRSDFTAMLASVPDRNPTLRDLRSLVISFCFSALFVDSDLSPVLITILTRLIAIPESARRIFFTALATVPLLFDCALGVLHDSLTFRMIPFARRRFDDEVQNQLRDTRCGLLTYFALNLRRFGMSADSRRRSVDFVSEPVSDLVRGNVELRRLLQRAPFSLVSFPAVLSLARKAEIFNMWTHMRPQLQGGYALVDPNFVLEVSREDLVNETFRALQRAPLLRLRQRLMVSFRGEHAVDAGGVSREFVYLFCNAIVREYGMFKRVASGAFWFDFQTFEMPSQFNSVGQVVALALYNQVLLPMRFPLVLYKKLIGMPLGLEDLEELDETVGKGLRNLLKMRENGEDVAVCDLRFIAGSEGFRGTMELEISEGGQTIVVTNENLDEYVSCFVDFMLTKSIERQFRPFSEGFRKVVGEDDPPFAMFQYDELDIMISGALMFDWSQLKATALYRNGYSERSRIIKWFWEVFEEMGDDEKKQLLRFTTGTDRSPTGGLGDVRLEIHRTGDPAKLPVGHTCFHILGLPEYPSKELLKKNLLIAIHWCEGFGLK